jgi:DNA replication and repair protein RecF
MRLTRIRAADFRNLTFADVVVDAQRVFLLGDNGQGKTNLLEAAGLVSAFRSFRTTEIAPLIRAGAAEARLRLDVALTGDDHAEVELRLAKGSRKALVNGNPVTSVAQHLGQFPTIVFCSDDLRLVRGSPGNRRRWLDAAIGGTDGAYLTAVRDYTRALEGRNALLKAERRSEEELTAFEQAMQAPGLLIARTRAAVLPELAATLREVCARAGFPDQGADLRYRPDCPAEQLAETWLKMRPADLATGTTLRGPQRDDFDILFRGEDAADYASEGQQRLLVLALSLARLQRDTRRAPTPPVILADDVLGELDDTRRRAFWEQVGETHQVIATGTVPPPSGAWLTYRVAAGAYAQA